MSAHFNEFLETHKAALALAQSVQDEAASIAYHIMRGEYGRTQEHECVIANEGNELVDKLAWLRERTKGAPRDG